MSTTTAALEIILKIQEMIGGISVMTDENTVTIDGMTDESTGTTDGITGKKTVMIVGTTGESTDTIGEIKLRTAANGIIRQIDRALLER
ncbi:MAG: hypothetical protein Q8R88_11495 [Desulfoprunum sp.]|nr:hypothetical protein [Desulfoprunum sp.]